MERKKYLFILSICQQLATAIISPWARPNNLSHPFLAVVFVTKRRVLLSLSEPELRRINAGLPADRLSIPLNCPGLAQPSHGVTRGPCDCYGFADKDKKPRKKCPIYIPVVQKLGPDSRERNRASSSRSPHPLMTVFHIFVTARVKQEEVKEAEVDGIPLRPSSSRTAEAVVLLLGRFRFQWMDRSCGGWVVLFGWGRFAVSVIQLRSREVKRGIYIYAISRCRGVLPMRGPSTTTKVILVQEKEKIYSRSNERMAGGETKTTFASSPWVVWLTIQLITWRYWYWVKEKELDSLSSYSSGKHATDQTLEDAVPFCFCFCCWVMDVEIPNPMRWIWRWIGNNR